MKFSKLRVVGFKSFVEPMEFIIANGLTGVVGPNGCGKSNLVEALRWVMGENSYKNMRASGMDDVIFSGSLNRPARNTAEVTLFLENRDRTAPSAFNDTDALEVSRRIERDAGSNYKINAKDVRARDVQLLFADASTGARSPSMVRQGQIGELISAKPTARRQILEEASGISGLHSRRKEAEIRLRGAEQNLERLEDVLVQIDVQLDNLRRQSRQAIRYRNLSSEIRSAEAAILYLRWRDAVQGLSDAQTNFDQTQKAVVETAALQAESARVQAIAAQNLPQLRDDAVAAGVVLQRLVIARNELDSQERRVKERLQDLMERLVQLDEDIDREQRMVSENEDVLTRLAEEQAGLMEENETVSDRADSMREKMAAAQDRVQNEEASLAEVTAAQARALAEREQIERQLSDTRQRSSRLAAQISEAAVALEAVQAEMSGQDGIYDMQMAVEMAEDRLMEAEEAADHAATVTAAAREAEQGARAPLAEAEKDLSACEAEARTLETVLNASLGGEWTPVVDQLTVVPGLETALGAALGEDLDASLAPQSPVRWMDIPPGPDDPPLPVGVPALGMQVSAPAALARRLSQIGLVDAADGSRLQALLKPGQRLVSKKGDLWRWDGLVVTADAPTAAAQRLAQKNRLTELVETAETAARRVQEARDGLDQAGAAVHLAVESEQTARNRIRICKTDAASARTALVELERKISQLSARKTAAEERVARLSEEAVDARETLMAAEQALASAPDAGKFQADISRLQSAVAAARAELAEARAIFEGIAREQQMRDQRLEAIARELNNWKSRAASAQAQIGILIKRKADLEEERDGLMEVPDEIEQKRRALFSQISGAEKEKKEKDDTLQKAETDQAEMDRLARSALDALSLAREEKIRAEERLEAARARKSAIEHQIDEVLDVSVSALPGVAGLKEGAPLPDLTALERKLDRFKSERERLGGVNLRAEEELREIDEHKAVLTAERDDLIEAIRRLRVGISNLNKEARERLLASFEVVNDHFQRLFTHLFGGGTAELKLVDSDDPLDAGLEIIARPPGKKPQTMTLLSGGEQALTAMALIFAVFLTNPAPICVLDEVDAPLDDANVERYCNLLDEMTARTQTRFIIITHNPITMARMNRLFGVTMAERGVSQLVSVDLETAERFRDAG